MSKRSTFCSDAQKAKIIVLQGTSREALVEIVNDESDRREAELKSFETDLHSLQEEYTELKKAHEARLLKLKQDYDIGIVKSILANMQEKVEL